MTRWVIAPLVLALASGCASSGSWPSKGTVAPKTGGIDRRVVDKDELAALLNDNPTSLARRAKEGVDDSAVAKKGDGDKGTQDDGQGGGPGDDDRPSKPDPEPLMKRAQEALEAKDYVVAARFANAVIEIDGKGYPYAYVVLGDVALAAKEYDKALVQYRTAMELDPKDGWAAQRAAQVLEKQGKLAEARDLLRDFVAGNANADADTWDALAWLELDLGDSKRAEAAFKKALEASDGKDAEAYYGLAMIAARRGDPIATEKYLTALFDLQPERRVVIERDPTFFRMRIHGNVKALFSDKKMAEAKAAAAKKKDGEAVASTSDSAKSSAGVAAASISTAKGDATKLSVPGGAEKTIGDMIRFDFDSASIKGESKATLDEIATFLKAQKGLEFVEITGHADRRGDEGYNIKLSQARANAVRDALILRGVPMAMLKTKGYGIYCPLDDGDDESAFARNRRVQFAIGSGGKVLGEELTCNERMRRWLKPGQSAKLMTFKK